MSKHDSAADIGLPSDSPPSRRAILTAIPAAAIGIGALRPSQALAAALPTEPATWLILEAYKTWLFTELRALCWEMADHPATQDEQYFRPLGVDKKARFEALRSYYLQIGQSGDYEGHLMPSERAVAVLRMAGCDCTDRYFSDLEGAHHG